MKILLTILGICFLMPAYNRTITVGKGKEFLHIKDGINNSDNGDTVAVYPGIYAEGELYITKSICLKGIKKPVLDGLFKYQIITIRAENVVLDGFRIKNSGYSSSYDWAAVKVIDGKSVTISNNDLSNNTFGIYLQESSSCSITNNQINAHHTSETESGNAIHCWKSDNIKILNNNISGHRDGIYFEFVTNSLIQNNTSYKNIRYGLHFMFSHNNSYIYNTFKNNGSGVAVMFSKNVTMRYNQFVENWGSSSYGILMKEISDGVIENNSFVRNTMGIYMEGTNRIKVKKNIFKSNGWAMRVQASSADNSITENNFIANTFDVGTNGTQQLNKFYSNYWDKYEGYDLNKDGIGDIQFLPVSLYSMIVEKMPVASVLLRSLMISVLDKAERLIPSITPVDLKDEHPLMKPLAL